MWYRRFPKHTQRTFRYYSHICNYIEISFWDEQQNLINSILKNNNITLSVANTDRTKLFKSIARNVNDLYRNDVLNYFDTAEASSLIPKSTSKPGEKSRNR